MMGLCVRKFPDMPVKRGGCYSLGIIRLEWVMEISQHFCRFYSSTSTTLPSSSCLTTFSLMISMI